MSKIFKVFSLDKRVREGHTIVYRFEMNGHIELIRWFNTFGTRHPKNIKKFNSWLKINKNNLRLINKMKRIAESGFEFSSIFDTSTDLRVMSPTDTPS